MKVAEAFARDEEHNAIKRRVLELQGALSEIDLECTSVKTPNSTAAFVTFQPAMYTASGSTVDEVKVSATSRYELLARTDVGRIGTWSYCETVSALQADLISLRNRQQEYGWTKANLPGHL